MPMELLIAVVALALVACARHPMVVLDPGADRAAVHAALDAYVAANLRHDAAALAGLYGEDAPAGAAQQLLSDEARREEGFGVHASMDETSRLLFLRPDLVHPAYRQAPPHTGRTMDDLIPIARAESWPGYFGSPRLASAALGAALWKEFSSRFVGVALGILDGFDYRRINRLGDVTRTVPANMAIDRAALEHDRTIHSKQQEWLRDKRLE
ncbi:MAG: creatininase family protein [Candidatus Latescibacterota bacterium]